MSSSRPGLFWCLVAACAGALLVSAVQTLFWPVFGWATTLRLLSVALPSAYVAFLLALAPARAGRLVLGVAAGVIATSLFFGPFGLPVIVLVEGAAVWIVRSVCYHRSILGTLVDGGLALAGLGAAAAAWASTQSLPTAAWTALLVQAAFVYVPQDWGRKPQQATAQDVDGFERAFQAAESALRDLATR